MAAASMTFQQVVLIELKMAGFQLLNTSGCPGGPHEQFFREKSKANEC